MQRAVAPTIATQLIDVVQNSANNYSPSMGEGAVILPAPSGPVAPANPVTLVELPLVWGHRRDRWKKQYGAVMGSGRTQGWYEPVNLVHRAATMGSSTLPAALHFTFDGQEFEVFFGGTNLGATLVVDGQYVSERYIRRARSAGTMGEALDRYDTYTKFDFGSRALRKISLYATSSLGPAAIAIAPSDTLSAWDRTAEPAMFGIADSYGQAPSENWRGAGIFFEAAALLGLPHVDINAIGGTGYAPVVTNTDTRNPGNAFAARIATMADAQPDLFVTAGGINDHFGRGAPPLYASAEAARSGFEAAARDYFRALRAALPDAVLVALAPWEPNAAFNPADARAKAAVIKSALSAVAAPWIIVDNLNSGWSNSSGAQDAGTGVGWQTGTGTVANPKGDGNGDLYVNADGTHPSEAGAVYLGKRLAQTIRSAIEAM